MGPSRGTQQRDATLGHIPPLFLGGSLTAFSTCDPGTQGEGWFTVDNHNRIRDIEESGFAAFLDFSHATPPPLSPFQTFRGTVT